MALDTRIPLMVQPVQLPDFNAMAQNRIGMVQNVMSIRSQQAEMERMARQQQEQNALRGVYSRSVDPETGKIDSKNLITGLAGLGRGDLIPGVQAEMAKAESEQAAAAKAKYEFGKQQLNDAKVAISSVKTPEDAYATIDRYVESGGMPPEVAEQIKAQIKADPKSLPAIQEAMLRSTLDAEKKLDFDFKEKQFAETVRSNQANEGFRRQEIGISAGRAAEDRRQNAFNRQVAVAELGLKSAKERREAAAGIPLTEGQGKAVTFGARMKDADRILKNLETGGERSTGRIKNTVGGIVGLVPLGVGDKLNAMTDSAFNVLPGVLGGPSAGQQQLDQAQRNFVNAVLRRESGAVISPSEFENARRQYFAVPGDSAAVIQQKQRNRAVAIAGLRREAGAGAADIDRISAPPPAKPKGKGVDTSNPLLAD